MITSSLGAAGSVGVDVVRQAGTTYVLTVAPTAAPSTHEPCNSSASQSIPSEAAVCHEARAAQLATRPSQTGGATDDSSTIAMVLGTGFEGATAVASAGNCKAVAVSSTNDSSTASSTCGCGAFLLGQSVSSTGGPSVCAGEPAAPFASTWARAASASEEVASPHASTDTRRRRRADAQLLLRRRDRVLDREPLGAGHVRDAKSVLLVHIHQCGCVGHVEQATATERERYRLDVGHQLGLRQREIVGQRESPTAMMLKEHTQRQRDQAFAPLEVEVRVIQEHLARLAQSDRSRPSWPSSSCWGGIWVRSFSWLP